MGWKKVVGKWGWIGLIALLVACQPPPTLTVPPVTAIPITKIPITEIPITPTKCFPVQEYLMKGLLVGWWPFDEGSGTVAHDIAGVPNDGNLVNGPTWISNGKVAGALHFDGQNDYVQVPDHPELNVGTGSFTLDVWVRTNWKGPTLGNVVVIVDKRGPAGYSLYLYNSPQYTGGKTVPGLQVNNGSSFENHAASAGPDVADGQWHHIAAVADVGTKKVLIYVDGALVYSGSSTILGSNLDNKHDFYIGRRDPTIEPKDVGYFPGDLDELELFKQALTQQEIQAIFQADSAGKCKPTPTPTATPTLKPTWTPTKAPTPTATPAYADLSLVKRLEAPSPWVVGQPGAFVISVSNLGPNPVPAGTIITVIDTIPAGMNYTGFSGPGWTCTPSSGTGPVTVTCTYSGGLAPGQAAPPLILNVIPTEAGKFENCAEAKPPLPDPKPDNNKGCTGGEIIKPTPTPTPTLTPTSTPTWTPTPTYTPAPSPTPTRACVPPPVGLVAWWPLEGTGNDIWDGHPGTLQGSPTPVPGYNGGLALDFTGGYVEVPDHPDFHFITGELTIDAWIRANSGVNPNDADEIVWKRTGGPNNTGFSFQLSGAATSPGQLQFAASSNGGLIATVTGGPNLRDGQWHHVAVTLKSGGQAILYVDGVQVAAAPAGAFSSLANPEPLRIGMPSAAWYPQTSFRGVIDEVEIFNRALSASEIQAIYRLGKCK